MVKAVVAGEKYKDLRKATAKHTETWKSYMLIYNISSYEKKRHRLENVGDCISLRCLI